MNIALIIAGGKGKRMHQDIPKQFLNVYDKPVIIYTLEAFQHHPQIDKIIVVCIDGWQQTLRAYCNQFGITKLDAIVCGGENGQDSIRNGVMNIAERYDDNDLILVHDAIRPMISSEIISGNLVTCTKYGNAVTVIPCAEAMLVTDDALCSTQEIQRDSLKRTQTPQTFRVGDLVSAHKEALERGITNSIASCTLFIELGRKVYFTPGSEKNVKLTTIDDIDIFKALLTTKKSTWLK